MTQIETARTFIDSAELPPLPARVGFEKAGGDSLIDFDQAKNQATMVASDLIAFMAGGVPAETRQDLVHASLLAQLATKRKLGVPVALADWDKWYTQYLDAMAHLGLAIQEKEFALYKASSDDFAAADALIAVAGELLKGVPDAVSIIRSALDGLRKLGADKWISLYKSDEQSARTSRFQTTVAGKDDSGLFVWIIGFGMEASASLQQILFVKLRGSDVKLKKHAAKFSLDATTLAAVRDTLAKKVAVYVGNYVRDLEI